MLRSDARDLEQRLAVARFWLGLARLSRWLILGTGAGTTLGALLLAADRLWHGGMSAGPGFGVVALGIVAGAGMGIGRWPSSEESARRADAKFALHDRLTTALQFRASNAPLARLQRDDVFERLRNVALRSNGRGELTWKEVAIVAIALIAFTVLATSPTATSANSKVASSHSDARRIQRAAIIQIPAMSQQLDANLAPPEKQSSGQRELQRRLAVLRHNLIHAASRADALRAISLTQQQLHQQGQKLRPVDPQSVASLNRTLKDYQPPARDNAHGPDAGTHKALHTVQGIANHLNKMTQAQRDKLARSLDVGANQSTDPRVRAALRQAASALANRDTRGAQRSLQQAAKLLQGSLGSAGLQKRINVVNSQLDKLKNALANIHRGPLQVSGQSTTKHGRTADAKRNPTSGNRAKGTSQGTQNANGALVRNGSKKSQGGSLQSSGSGPKSGTSAGTTERTNGIGGFSAYDSTPSGGSQNAGKFATVYIPGLVGQNIRSISTGQRGLDRRAQIIPYRQVFVRYAKTAGTALGRSSLPPNLQTLVHEYFALIAK